MIGFAQLQPYLGKKMLVTTTTLHPGDYSLNSEPIMPCSILPVDALVTIFKELDKKKLGEVALVSREWYVISSSDTVWGQYFFSISLIKPQHLKYQLKCQLGFGKIYSVINKNLPIENSNELVCDSFCKLIDVLFKGNIFTITEISLDRFELILNKTRQLNFEDKSITQILIPKKVCFLINRTNIIDHYEQSLNFIHKPTDLENPIKMQSSSYADPTFLSKIEWIDRFSTFKFLSHAPHMVLELVILPKILFNPSSVQDC